MERKETEVDDRDVGVGDKDRESIERWVHDTSLEGL